MHMADALLSPEVGIAMTAVSIGALAFSAARIKKEDSFDEKKVPVMGVMGAFIFAGQMINFTIPGTGSSGHIGGGILLAALLGPYPALLTIAAVLIIQCLFFADGGILAFGCNIFNMGVISCIFAYPLIFKPIIQNGLNLKRVTIASIVAVVLGLQFGAFAVVLETLASGITEIPFSAFVALMQPIHLAIGLVEGIVTASVLCFVYNMRPELLQAASTNRPIGGISTKKIITIMLILAIIISAVLSLFASSLPDGLEWSMLGVANTSELQAHGSLFDITASIQKFTAFMPDYTYKSNENAGTSIAGLVGGGLTLLLTLLVGSCIIAIKRRRSLNEGTK